MNAKRMFKRYSIRVTVLFVLVALLAAICFGGGYATAFAAESINDPNEFDRTNVLADLESSTALDGGKFYVSDYPKDTEGEVRIINFVEYCYSYTVDMRGNYGLYIYIYNPTEQQIDISSDRNTVQMAVSYDEDGIPDLYEKFTLQFCTKSTGDYKNRFYKFRILDHVSEDGKTIVERVDSNERRYDISGIELLYEGESTAEDYGVGGTFKITGYSAGYGPDETAESTLHCNYTSDLLTITLDLTANPNNSHTTYRTDMDNPDMRSHNQIDSVYFSIPNEVIEKYGKLQKIMAEWWEYRTTPIIVTEDERYYNELLKYVGTDIGGVSNDDVTVQMYTDDTTQGDSENYKYLDWAYNMPERTGLLGGTHWYRNETSTMFAWLFYTNGVPREDFVISSQELEEYMYDYSELHGSLENDFEIKEGKVSSDLFTTDVGSNGDTPRKAGHNIKNFDANEDAFDMNTYDPEYSGWNKLLHAFGYTSQADEALTDISPIYPVTEADFRVSDVASRLLIDEDDVSFFKNYCEQQWEEGNTVYLFRFALTEYEADPLYVNIKGDLTTTDWYSYMARENMFLDFDIIQFTFMSEDGQYRVIPVVSSPIDILPNVEAPAFDNGAPWWMYVLVGLAVLVVVILLRLLLVKAFGLPNWVWFIFIVAIVGLLIFFMVPLTSWLYHLLF